MRQIVVLDGYTTNPGDNPWTPVEQFGEMTVYDRTPADEIIKRATGADIIITNKTPLRADTLKQLPELRFVSTLSTGTDVIDLAAARQQGVIVSNVPHYCSDAVAQFVFALLLEATTHVALHDQTVHAGEWAKSVDFCFWKAPLLELADKTMGIVGFGRIGRKVGRIAHAFGMEVLAASPTTSDPPHYEPFAWAGVEELFERSDVVSLHCPLTSHTKGMVNFALLGRMKKGSILINTARGAIINEQDLTDALAAGKLAAAGLDVVSAEPIKSDNPLLAAPNCILTPHIAWASLAARQRLLQQVAANIRGFLDGKPVNVVNLM